MTNKHAQLMALTTAHQIYGDYFIGWIIGKSDRDNFIGWIIGKTDRDNFIGLIIGEIDRDNFIVWIISQSDRDNLINWHAININGYYSLTFFNLRE